ncbi:hypothetical protein J45TS6_45850 [Paenibacillus sp. J45TS6]|uniref:Spo0E family sporulation regulatory protein-aspartic acid phosphatase n=1 Tax=unclassified Paenibacillus TaxID=185978 RepID=UPI00191DE693|nr:Spo0E family sporulation regulatory protein-aspartic acid phosphatase [Paenibacillus sp. J45TS6]GIP46126.1 hypothetical protein J45TS6_45850 [Paenibacillus sp. J45TS6]
MIEKNRDCIEQARKQLNALAKEYNNDFQHPVVIKQSMLLEGSRAPTRNLYR